MTASQLEREALALVDAAASDPSDIYNLGWSEACTLKRMLAEPRLPDELTDELVESIWCAGGYGSSHRDVAENLLGVLREHVTRPPTKKVWRLTWQWEADGKSGEETRDEATLKEALWDGCILQIDNTTIHGLQITQMEVLA